MTERQTDNSLEKLEAELAVMMAAYGRDVVVKVAHEAWRKLARRTQEEADKKLIAPHIAASAKKWLDGGERASSYAIANQIASEIGGVYQASIHRRIMRRLATSHEELFYLDAYFTSRKLYPYHVFLKICHEMLEIERWKVTAKGGIDAVERGLMLLSEVGIDVSPSATAEQIQETIRHPTFGEYLHSVRGDTRTPAMKRESERRWAIVRQELTDAIEQLRNPIAGKTGSSG